ncbi:response regulator [Maridesulfovibrio sp.]|uniref:response regulator n=1 Tax=Maridesulfovibrio sp. TaxID=2795000 RepID=UPI0029CA9DFE|nr:response regulator [Maridesulfovibrio sp.]
MTAEDISKLSILVAEDSPPVRLVLKTYLGKLGIAPQFAEDGQEAMDMLSRDHYDMAFMDVHMPEMDGRDVVAGIRKKGIKIPIIAMTTGDDPDLLQSCLESGYSTFMLKPILQEDVFRLVKKFH